MRGIRVRLVALLLTLLSVRSPRYQLKSVLLKGRKSYHKCNLVLTLKEYVMIVMRVFVNRSEGPVLIRLTVRSSQTLHGWVRGFHL